MSEVVEFHRKYRPSTLEGYIGNASIKKAALTFLPLEHKPQVILLHGHSGCGKTTFARLLCSCYSCEHPKPNGDACGECDTCKEFAHYIETGDNDGLINITEVDVTDDSGKKAVEALIDEMYAPSLTGGWKCFIFDECHLMTPSAQARLLKTIEEPPEKVLICLCTTNPEKLLDTITSRCHYQFRVQKPKREEIIDLLAKVCVEEGVTAERRGLSLVATKGNLVPRDSLIQLQKVVRACGSVTYENAANTLEVIADKYYFMFYNFLLASKIETYKYVSFIHEITTQMDMSEFLVGLIDFTTRGIYIYNNIPIDGLDAAELRPYSKLFANFAPAELVFMMDYLTSLRGDPDMEIKLLKLGYTGINHSIVYNQEGESTGELSNIDDLGTSAAADAQAGSENFNQNTTMTDAERNEIVQQATSPVEMNDVLKMFGGYHIKT